MRYMPHAGAANSADPGDDDVFDVTSAVAESGPKPEEATYKSPTLALLRGLGRILWRHLDPSMANHQRGVTMLALMALLALPASWVIHLSTLAMPLALSAGLFAGIGLALGASFMRRALRHGEEDLFSNTHLSLIVAGIMAGFGLAPATLIASAIGPGIVAYGLGAFAALAVNPPTQPKLSGVDSAQH